jgi:dipeptidyl aminopeptidase/acylaminoacyl peptidase
VGKNKERGAFISLNRPLSSLAILLVAVSCLPGQALLAADGKDGTILHREIYIYPRYEEATWVEKYHTKETYEKVIADDNFLFERLTYLSDGLQVVAYLYAPRETKGQRFPAVIYNRGSYVVGDIGGALAPLFHRLASEGFVVVAPLCRGSAGGEGQDEMGGADVSDLMNVFPLLRSLGFVDTENLFMYGESRGGMMTFQAIRDGSPLRAAAVFGAFTDLEAMLDSEPRYQMAQSIWPDFETRREEIIQRRSAVKWAEEIDVPLLLMHGSADSDVDASHALNMAQRIQELGKTYELVIYGNDNHILSRNKDDRDRRAIAWFNKFMTN